MQKLIFVVGGTGINYLKGPGYQTYRFTNAYETFAPLNLKRKISSSAEKKTASTFAYQERAKASWAYNYHKIFNKKV